MSNIIWRCAVIVWNEKGTNTYPPQLIRCLSSELFQPWDYHANPNNSNVQLVWTTICTIVYVVIAGSHSWGVTILVDSHLLFQCHIQGWRALSLKWSMFWVLCSIFKRGIELKRRSSKALVNMKLKFPRLNCKRLKWNQIGWKDLFLKQVISLCLYKIHIHIYTHT